MKDLCRLLNRLYPLIIENIEMGNTETNQAGNEMLEGYTQVRKEVNGLILSDKSGENHYFLKEFNYADKKEYESELNKYREMEKGEVNENLLALISVTGREFNNFCSNSFKIYVLYEYPLITLEEEILARGRENKYFEECELWSILQSCANALNEVKSTISLNPRNVFIVPDGVLKVINNDMITEDHRCLVKQNVYYAPEKIKNFHKNDNENSLRKQTIFSMGMTILHAALLAPLYDCYHFEKFEFDEDLLQQHIEELLSSGENGENKYSEEFIEMLAMIVEPNPNKRASLMEVHGMLNKVWTTQNEEGTVVENECEEETTENNGQNYQEREAEETKLKESELNMKKKDNYEVKYTISRMPSDLDKMAQVNSINQSERPSKPYLDTHTATTTTYNFNKENLYTDPKLLEMIRKDLKDLNTLKRSSMISQYSHHTYAGYTPYESSASILQPSQQIYHINTEQNITKPSYSNSNSKRQSLINNLHEEKSLAHSKREEDCKREIDRRSEAKEQKRVDEEETVTEEYEDGRKFEGHLVNGLKEGFGKLMYEDGAYYEGEFKEDKMHGKGVLFYGPQKPAYDGEWSCDQFHGYGSLYNENPITLNGSFNYNDFNLIEDFWVKYEGQFEGDNKSGRGTLYLSNGEKFCGEFDNDFINGRGTFTTQEEGEISGIWEENVLVQLDA